MKEIGGYFGLEQLVSNEYYKGLIPLNNARYSLLYLLKAKNIKKIYLPYYLVNVVREMCSNYDYNFELYHIEPDFMPVFDKKLEKNEYLCVVNYFGQLTDEKILFLKNKLDRVILDNVQSFFQRPLKGIDTFYACEKYFGVPDGGYLATDATLTEEIEVDISKDRMTHVLGRFEDNASNYYSIFQKHMLLFDDEPLKYMSKLTHNIMGAIDYEKVCKTGDENYSYLSSRLEKTNKIKLITPKGPFAYPYYIKNGVEVRKILAQKKLYIPTLWPDVIKDNPVNSIENEYAANILPLPCDQRYGIEEMEFLADEVSKFIK